MTRVRDLYFIDASFERSSLDGSTPESMVARLSQTHGNIVFSIARGEDLTSKRDQLLTALARAPGTARSIRSIRILSHGSPGRIELGVGLVEANVHDLFTPALRPYLATSFGPRTFSLTRYPLEQTSSSWQSHHTGVVLLGCNIAALSVGEAMRGEVCANGEFALFGWGSPGFGIMRAIAETLWVNVSASIDTQPARDHWELEGRYVSLLAGNRFSITGFDPATCGQHSSTWVGNG